MPKVIIALTAGLILAGLIQHGASYEALQRLWHDLLARPSGPVSFRLVLQPCMSAIAALHDGVADARVGRPPFLRALLTMPEERPARILELLSSSGRIILLGIAMDAIYQWLVLGTFYPAEALIFALLLACVPYLVLRGPIARIARWWLGPAQAH